MLIQGAQASKKSFEDQKVKNMPNQALEFLSQTPGTAGTFGENI